MPEVIDATEEVVNGEIRIMPPPKFRHARMVQALNKRLTSQLEARRVIVVSSDFGLIIHKTPLTSRVPDLAVFEEDTLVEQDGYIHSAPQLIVEVLSPANTRRKRQEKLDDYAAIGVPEVWIFSPEARTVEVLLLKDARLQTDRILPQSAILTATQFPEIRLDLASIWPD